MTDKWIAKHLHESGEDSRGMENGADCPSMEKKHYPGKYRCIT